MAKMAKSAAALALEALDELLDTIGQIQSLHEHTIAESAPLPAAVKSRFDKLRNQYTVSSCCSGRECDLVQLENVQLLRTYSC